MSKKVMFLFGAGAEGNKTYNLPSGPDYTKDTILTKKSKLYSALNTFYQKRIDKKYVNNYQSEFLFKSNSYAFKEMIEQSIISLWGRKDEFKFLKELFDYHPQETDKEKTAFNDAVKKYYQMIIAGDKEEKNEEYKDELQSLFDNMSFFGTIEKDFAGINEPSKFGEKRFWRLINYFWSAFFSILIPMLKNTPYRDYHLSDNINQEDYSYVLTNLIDIVKTIYSTDYYSNYKVLQPDADYYTVFRNELSKNNIEYFASTTNYTPFILKFTEEERISFLAGELRTFETPTKLEVNKITEDLFSETDFVFPFIMTQAPIKPIICTYQIKEYAKFVEQLEKSDVLVIVGYSIGEADNHINALIRDYYKMEGKKIIFCQYSHTNDKESIEKGRENIVNNLKLNDIENKERLIIVTHDGNDAKALIDDIIDKL